ncbi:uncharacterized protein LOC113311896 [Papaver somniferum]|uniref:uncharacterized protein LOC113311896 n=1 Tax=Papaver somniferum TaxID=3469 RepID=UPI000E6F5623|nr:uncharacterized protein LOC113311896 [Papaver somniferum]
MVLLLYVDDIILTGNSDDLLIDLVKYLSHNFEMKELGDLHYFLGLEAVRSDDAIMLTQKKYTMELLAKSHMLECNPCSTPVAKVNYVSQYMHAPTDIHLLLVKRILRYLKGTIGYGITLIKGDIECLTAYTDSDWGSCPETARFTCGYAIFMGNSLISWSSKKQPTVSRSTAKAENEALSVATAKLEWLASLFSELHIQLKKPINLVKHIKIHYHVVRELIEEGFLTVQHVASENQLADLFTKGLCTPIFASLLSQLLGLSSTSTASTSDIPSSTSAPNLLPVITSSADISKFQT